MLYVRVKYEFNIIIIEYITEKYYKFQESTYYHYSYTLLVRWSSLFVIKRKKKNREKYQIILGTLERTRNLSDITRSLVNLTTSDEFNDVSTTLSTMLY